MSDLTVPEMVEFRDFVDTKVPKPRDRALIKLLYLTAARICELTTKTTAYDIDHNLSKPYGQYLKVKFDQDFRLDGNYLSQPNPIVIIKIPVAKRKPKQKPLVKSIALPLEEKYEPWILDILRWALTYNNKKLCFNLSRWSVWNIVRKNLKPRLKTVQENMKDLCGEETRLLNPWRHWRITHLVENYGFNGYDLAIYTGWTYRTAIGVAAGQQDTYLHLNWRNYIKKLFVPYSHFDPKFKAKEEVAA